MKDLSQDDVVDIGSAKISISWRTVGSLQKKTSEKALRAKTAQLKRVSVTVLVSRAQAYREMLQKIAAHDAEATLSSWMSRVQDIIFRFGGCTDKTIEETVVALWVGDQAQAQGERAALAAQAILSASKTFDAEWRRAAQTPWRSSVVVASGHGLAGSVGAANEGRRFAMIGDPVNLAFALESEIQNFDTQIIFDDLTVRAIEATIPTRLIGHSTRVERGIEVPIFSLK
jgi:class 3 adenylate cyclase